MVTLKINGIPVQAEEGTTIIEAARLAGIDIPSLCYLKDINCIGACRVCVVEVKGARSLVASCVYPVEEGLEVWTNTPKVRQSRQTTLELLLSEHTKNVFPVFVQADASFKSFARTTALTRTASPTQMFFKRLISHHLILLEITINVFTVCAARRRAKIKQ